MPSSVVTLVEGPSGQIHVAVVPECEETEQKTKTEKLGKGCRTGVCEREERVLSCWKDAIGCVAEEVMSGFTTVSWVCSRWWR